MIYNTFTPDGYLKQISQVTTISMKTKGSEGCNVDQAHHLM